MPVHARPSSLRPARLSDRSRRSRSAVALHVEHLEQRCLLSASPWPALLAPLAEAEPNDTLDAAQQLGALDDTGRAEVIGAIAPAGADVDWYNFTLNSPASVDLTSLAPADGGQSAAILSLFNSHPWEWSDPTTPLNYRFLAQSTLDGSGNAHITRDLGPGTYNLAVSGAGNRYFQPFLANSGLAGATGDYGLLLTATDLASAGAVPPVVLGADTTAGPAPGATTDRSPAMVYLNLSGPLDPSVQYDLNITLTAAGDSTNLVGNYNFSFDANELAIAPSKALAPGDYDLGIAALSNSGLPALDQDYTFHVHVTGIEGNTGAAAVADDTAATAHDLGDLTQPRFVQVAGAIGDDPAYDLTSLDPLLANPAADVDLYHFRVNDSGNFALIAEVFAGRIGSALDPGLTLFRLDPSDGKLHFVVVIDNSGNDIAATDGSTPLYNDPVLFAGLTAGDYYLAVSSTGNLPDPGQGIGPGDNGVFDPNVAHSGFAGYSTGSYVLNLFIYPDNVAPQVIDATPAEQATLDAPPTSLTVAFDEPVNLEQLAAQIKQQGGPGTLPSVYVHGADGVDYYPRLTDYNMNGNQATFLMLDALPNGVNELHLSGARGVTDLAGNPLASNDPSGDYVVHFTVAGPARGQVATNPGPTHGLWVWNDQEPNNTTTQPQVLGTLFPNELQQGVALVRNATSGASDTVDYYQFEVLESRPYFFTLTGTNLPANAQPYLKEVSTGRSIALIVQ
ncbi:MAG TPA: DVUA0089 family protein, partial [Gemmataceae bacterium]|nr:DVUA0089 family protein [Gemmataceae bacterium]